MHFISENTRKCNFLSALCALLIFGTVIQIYVFTSNIVLVTDRMSIRFVTNNEFIPLWASLASFPIFWCTTYILVKACYWQPLTSSTNSSKINWFPVNPRVQVVLWLTYALLMFSLGVSTSVLFFRLYIRTKFVLSILAYAIPILVSILATPLLAKALRNPSPQNHESDQNSDKQHSAANNKINAIAYTSPDYLKHINSPGNLSIQSKISQGTKISGNTECSYVPFSPTSELDTQALTNSALTLKQISDLHHNIDNRCSWIESF
ncbi:hypothetical protein BX070DRAFT_57816 [Coemansia spiralis]|nr:hypothetical protein BX070DRAFT_57816 [Coemansia spiralis]